MKNIAVLCFLFFAVFSGFSMSRPKVDDVPDIITGSPVYIGNVPFERLAVEVSEKDGKKIVYQLEIPEGSKITERELSALQGRKVQFSGKITDDFSFPGTKIFIISGYKADGSVK